MKIRKAHEEEIGFQIAPMCDVLLVLLVFFVTVTSASVLRSDREIKLPAAPNSTKKKTAMAEALLNSRWSEASKTGFVTLESVKYDNLEDLTKILEPRFKANNQYRVVIRADRSVPSKFVQKIMSACAEAGISDITFAVMNKES